ncbi:hypothetical protein AYO40_02820 [Planctomycetaceae bacterium SCGC AG-212-D15]|nr:hypothetical protein AYO40_02820 [Planctomycetaceae bacterium SCGC AG-212-D15]
MATAPLRGAETGRRIWRAGLRAEETSSTLQSVQHGARHYAFIGLCLVGLAVYASLFPFTFQNLSWSEVAAKLQAGMVFDQPFAGGDFLGNILLFAPLGYFLLGALRVDQPARSGSMVATLRVLLITGLLSCGLEFAQAFFPPRCPFIGDIMAQVLGSCLGIAVWQCCGRSFTARLRRAWQTGDLRDQAGFLLGIYLLAIVFLHVLPMDLNFSLAWRKSVHGVSRALSGELPAGGELRHAWDVVFWVPAGLLAAFVAARVGRQSTEWRSVLVLGILAIAAVTSIDLFARGRTFDPLEIFTSTAAFGLGWIYGRALRRGGRTTALGATPAFVICSLLLNCAWIAAAVYLLNGQMVEYTENPSVIMARLRTMNWLPLNDLYRVDYLAALREVSRKSLLFLLGGGLMARTLPRWVSSGYAVPAALIALMTGLALAIGVETLVYSPSVTAILFQTVAAWLGFVLVQGLRPAGERLHSPTWATASRSNRCPRTGSPILVTGPRATVSSSLPWGSRFWSSARSFGRMTKQACRSM